MTTFIVCCALLPIGIRNVFSFFVFEPRRISNRAGEIFDCVASLGPEAFYCGGNTPSCLSKSAESK